MRSESPGGDGAVREAMQKPKRQRVEGVAPNMPTDVVVDIPAADDGVVIDS